MPPSGITPPWCWPWGRAPWPPSVSSILLCAAKRRPRRVPGACGQGGIRHACAGLDDAAISDRVALHRCVEVLAVLAERGLVLPDGIPAIATTVQALVAARPHLPWAAADAARALEVSEATLRRRLAAEGTCFRDLAAEARLGHGLHLLQTTRQPIIEVAAACGYDSPSRFAARFRDRFGMSPSELRGIG